MERFTNREAQQTVFSRFLNAPAGDFPRLPAVMFFGVGGIGKTWLLRHMQGQLASIWRGIPSARIDFTLEGVSNRLRDDPSAVLAVIREITEAPCPRFDLAYGFLQVQRGIREESSLDVPGRKTAFSVVNEIIRSGLGLVPIAGPTLQLGYTVLEKLYPHLKNKVGLDSLARLLQQDLRLLRNSPPEDIEKTLVWRLAQDLKTEGTLPVRQYRAVQAVVFIDTLEAQESMDASTSRLEIRTRWLRDLICELNDRVLFVLAGQNRLTWERIDPDWADPSWLDQHPVNGLSEIDAREFLLRCGFENPKVQQAMLDACLTADSAYHTFHLGLLADLAWVEREVNHRIVTPALFSALPAGDWTALALRFLKSLAQQSDSDWLQKLALTPEFDETAARAAHSTHASQSQDTDWRMLRSFSFFVGVEGKAGWWSIHSAMQRAIVEDLLHRETDLWRDMHQWWREYWAARTSSPKDTQAPLAWYHGWHLQKQAALREWNDLVEVARSAQPVDMAFHYRLLSWWQPIQLLDLPDWTVIEAQAGHDLAVEYCKSSLGDRGANLREAIACYERALEVWTRESYPQNWAMTQNNLGNAWNDRPDGYRGANLREAIACYERALEVRTRESYPQNWAMTQNNLGSAWNVRPDGDRGANLREAIACYERALEVRTRESYPQNWAMTQNNLGNAWNNRPDGDRGANLREAIACYERALEVWTRESYPQDWAMTQNNLGTAWKDRPDGDRGANLREAVACYERALEVWTRESYPQDWAMTQNNLGTAWNHRPDGDRGANLREAIACYERALEVWTRESYPQNWAMTQNNLGNAWNNRPDGDRGANLREAIACYERALEVRTRESYPQDWAMTQNNLGTAWKDRPDGDRGANLREAVACYERALEVWTRESYPQDWAMTQNNLGTAWNHRPDGDRGANLREAIACYERALEVRTRESYPQDWALTQNNLGYAWNVRPDGDTGANVREAIACYERALEVRTRESYPQNWAMTQNNLGTAWNNRPDGDRGANLREAIACYERALEVRTRESYPQDWAMTQNNLDKVLQLLRP